jgi:hypothetical protein
LLGGDNHYYLPATAASAHRLYLRASGGGSLALLY